MPFVYIEKVLDLWVQLMKNGGKNKSVVFIILFSVYYNMKNLHIELRPCSRTAVNRVSFLAYICNHWFWSLYWAHQAPS